MTQSTISLNDFKEVLCLGVAGNFAGHLEQAGETPDFVNVQTAKTNAPKGMFPYYVPHSQEQVGSFPLSSTKICYPQNLAENAHLQGEPEVCVLFDVSYRDELIIDITPKAFAAFNDCSIRKPGAKKISEKKNWGTATKGISDHFIALNSFKADSELDVFRIASFLKRDGEIHAYGRDSSVLTYSYFHEELKTWMVDKLNTQEDFGPLENLHQLIKESDYPKQVMISLGATTYTEFGESVFLQPGDELSIYLYDASQNTTDQVQAHLNGELDQLINSSVLQQKIT